MDTAILNNEINTKNDLISFAKNNAPACQLDSSIDPYFFLLALMTVESSFGFQNVPRFEYSFSKNSIAYKRSTMLQQGYELWGDLCACSYGPCQILWIVAKEQFGFAGHPLELWHGAVSVPYAVNLLNKLTVQGASSLAKLAGAYNGGPGVIKNPASMPLDYVKKFTLAYQDCSSRYQ